MRGDRSTIEFKVEVVVEPDEDGFHAYCPALKGLHTCGKTKEEALQNAGDAATAYLTSLIKHRDPIPVGVVMREEIEKTPHDSTDHTTHHTEDLRVACAIS